ncbi:MAG TPA: hypothetical protein VF794_21055 [Archangium sp.]|jgi:hypothetical protein|uniref:hypothetical protein n=1 Tax=Archangium sp. TaxID=1872627 RepID=UPI002ED862A3
MNDENGEKVRFGRAQKFRLTQKGNEAVSSYTLMLERARAGAGTGRGPFDAARESWSGPRGLTAEDGLFLVEFGVGDRTIPEATRSLEDCATTKEVKAAIERLLACGMLEPVPAPPAPPPAAPRRYW